MNKVYETALAYPGQNPNYLVSAKIKARKEIEILEECLRFVPNDQDIKQEIARIKSLPGYQL